MTTAFRFKIHWQDHRPTDQDTATGFGQTEADARQNLIDEGMKPNEVLECVQGPFDYPRPEINTDFGPNGPQPGTAAYTSFIMAQLFPTNEEDGLYDGFWDDWKDRMKDEM